MNELELCRQVNGKVWVGLDVHKKTCTATAFDPEGREVASWEFATTPSMLDEFANGLPRGAGIGLEASTTGKAVYRRLAGTGLDVAMASPRKLKMIVESDDKSDPRDSFHLGHLRRTGYFPSCYVPPMELQRVRDIVHFRMGLGNQVAAVKNKVHALVSKNLLDHELEAYSDIFGRSGLEKLVSLPFPDDDRTILDAYLEQLITLASQEEKTTEEMARLASGQRDVELLMTIPGVDFYSALAIIGEIGDVKRFPNKKKLASYAGVVPKSKKSGEVDKKHLPVRRGNDVLKYFLCCGVQGSLRAKNPSKVARFYKKKAKQIGAGKAEVAAARMLAGIIWRMLTDGAPYKEEDEALTARKKKRMERRAKALANPVSVDDLKKRADELIRKEETLRRLPAPQEVSCQGAR